MHYRVHYTVHYHMQEEEEEELISRDGVKAPSWYVKAKRTAETKQAAARTMYLLCTYM